MLEYSNNNINMSLSYYISNLLTNNHSILFSITNTISVTYDQLLLTYLVPKYIPVVYEQ